MPMREYPPPEDPRNLRRLRDSISPRFTLHVDRIPQAQFFAAGEDRNDHDIIAKEKFFGHQQTTSINETPLTTAAQALDNTVSSIVARRNLCRLVAIIIALVIVAALAIVLAAVRNRTGIAVVSVYTTEDAAVDRDYVVDEYMARTAPVVIAIAAGSRDLSVIFGVKVLDTHGAKTAGVPQLNQYCSVPTTRAFTLCFCQRYLLELNNLIRRGKSTTAVDVGRPATLLEGYGVLAHVLPL